MTPARSPLDRGHPLLRSEQLARDIARFEALDAEASLGADHIASRMAKAPPHPLPGSDDFVPVHDALPRKADRFDALWDAYHAPTPWWRRLLRWGRT